MKAFYSLACTALALGSLATVGCDVFLTGRPREETVYVQQQPQYVEAEPQYILVQQAPPPVIVERRPLAPSANVIWIDGYWHWDSQRYTWQAGAYQAPPQADAVWVAPRYETVANGVRYTPGRWSKASPGPGHDNGHDNGNGRGRGN